MTNMTRGIISMPYEGQNLQLRIATNEWCELEDEHGKTTNEILSAFFEMAAAEKLDMRFTRTFFRAALSTAIPGVTHEAAGEIMSNIGLVEAVSVIGKVILASMPEAKEPEGKTPGKPATARSRR